MNRSMISYPTMILYSVGLHLMWGITGSLDASAYNSTALSAIYRLCGSLSPVVCFVVAILAILGLNESRKPLAGLLLMLPQQTLLLISAFGAAAAIASSHFADGVVRSRAFIAADQIPAILAAVGHTIAIVRYTINRRHSAI